MDNYKKLSEELLKIDGIDPANISDTERATFKEMLDKERKHLEKLKSWSNGIFIVFLSLALYGVYKFKHIFAILHIPLIAAWPIMIVFSFGMLFLLWPRNFQQITKSTTKIKNLDFLVQGKHKSGLILGKKNGKRYVDWLNLTLIFIAFWLIIILIGYIFFKDMFGYSIFHPTLSSLLHIIIITITVVPVIIIDIYFTLKTPLEELTEIKTEDYNYSRRKFTFKIMTIILVTVLAGIFFSDGFTSVALADVVKKLEQVTNGVFKKTTTTYSLKDNNKGEFDSLTYYADGVMLENMYRDNKLIYQVYVTFLKGILVNIDYQKKEYGKIELSDEDIQEFSQLSPSNIVNLILSKGGYKKLGRKTIDGILSEGFEFNDKRIMLSFDKNNIEDVTIRLWVDIKTDLPVRIEIEGIYQKTLKANVVMFEPQWNVELEADFFEPKIPEGYILPEERGYVGINLQNWPDIKVNPEMPAGKAGIKDGDIILKINDNIITDSTSSSDAMNMLFGKIGEKDIITVQRGEQTLTFEVEKAALPK